MHGSRVQIPAAVEEWVHLHAFVFAAVAVAYHLELKASLNKAFRYVFVEAKGYMLVFYRMLELVRSSYLVDFGPQLGFIGYEIAEVNRCLYRFCLVVLLQSRPFRFFG